VLWSQVVSLVLAEGRVGAKVIGWAADSCKWTLMAVGGAAEVFRAQTGGHSKCELP